MTRMTRPLLVAVGLAAVAAAAAGQAKEAAKGKPAAARGAARAAQPAPAAEPARPAPLAVVDGQPIELAQVDELIAPQLAEIRAREQELRQQALETLIAQTLIAREATARGLSVDALDKAEVRDKAAVTEAEVKAWFDNNRARIGSTPEAEAMRQIREGLTRQREGERRNAFAKELRTKYPVKVLIEPHRVAVETADAPVRGNLEAPVTVVEFSDFQCAFCSRARPTVAKVRATYGDKVRWVFRHFPLNFHNLAQKAGEAAACAGDQGKFWEMHDELWANAGKLAVPDLKAHAQRIGLEAGAFDQCLDSGRHAGVVQRDLQAGVSYGVSGTPAFFVNGRPLVGAQPFEAFQQVIDDELQRASPPPASASR